MKTFDPKPFQEAGKALEEFGRRYKELAGTPEMGELEAAERRNELITIDAVMAAAKGAFNPRDDRTITQKQLVDICCGLVWFLKFAKENAPTRSIDDWRESIEALQLYLGRD